MRKMKKINGYLVVKFNARELREYDDETGCFYPLTPPDPEPGPEIVTTDEFTEAYNEGRDSV